MNTYVLSAQILLQQFSNKISNVCKTFTKYAAAYSYIMDDEMADTIESSRENDSEGAVGSVDASDSNGMLRLTFSPNDPNEAHIVRDLKWRLHRSGRS